MDEQEYEVVTELSRPPIGLEPRKIWVEARTRAVLEAMLRYVNAGYAVPQAWRDELGLNLADLEDEASP